MAELVGIMAARVWPGMSRVAIRSMDVPGLSNIISLRKPLLSISAECNSPLEWMVSIFHEYLLIVSKQSWPRGNDARRKFISLASVDGGHHESSRVLDTLKD